jgi:hypothetical protein
LAHLVRIGIAHSVPLAATSLAACISAADFPFYTVQLISSQQAWRFERTQQPYGTRQAKYGDSHHCEGHAVTESGIMKMIRMSEVNTETSWSSVTRELARRLALISDRLSKEELSAIVELAALSYQKARAEYQASVAYDLLLLRLKAKTPKRD